MVAIAVHIIFGLMLLFAMKSEVKAPEQPSDPVQVEQLNEKTLQ